MQGGCSGSQTRDANAIETYSCTHWAVDALPDALIKHASMTSMWHAIARSFLNIRCANFRDKYQTWAVNKQKDYYSKCMSQDCEQSLESGKDNPGCRYVEPKWGFCYGEPRHCHQPHPTPLPCSPRAPLRAPAPVTAREADASPVPGTAYGTTQTWCEAHPKTVGCVDKGSTLFGGAKAPNRSLLLRLSFVLAVCCLDVVARRSSSQPKRHARQHRRRNASALQPPPAAT